MIATSLLRAAAVVTPLTAAAALVLTGILHLPTTLVTATQAWQGEFGNPSTMEVTLANVPAGFDVANGLYNGWCIEDNHRPDAPPDSQVLLFDSTAAESSLPPSLQGRNWDKVNYLLNHRGGNSVADVQVAMWILVDYYDGSFGAPSAAALQLIADADAHGAGYVPGPSAVVAVLLFTDGIGPTGYQDSLIEVQNPPLCPCRSEVFPLGAAASYAVLALDGADLDIGSAATQIDGDVGLGVNTTGSMIKATITGKLFRDPTSTAAQHPDLVVNGGTFVASLGSASSNALAASSAFAAMTPTQTFGNLTQQSITITGTGGLNVIQIQSLSVVGGTLTFVGGPSDTFLINVLGNFTWNGGTMLVQGGVTKDRVLWNFPTTGNAINIYKPVMVAIGTFLAPFRDVILDKGTLFGAIIGGRRIVVHSGAQLDCPRQ
ncbi:MAG TPA: choice-of-anchor A family protein [Planctomycetota bacterium]|nr:choice-of-anchor A family protein [Planctomycetota bacterium]